MDKEIITPEVETVDNNVYLEQIEELKNKMDSMVDPEKFKALEETHPEIKVFLDLNRYSEIITSKLTGNYDLAKKLKKDVKIKNLTPKKIFLMTCPVFVLKFFIRIQPILIKYGLRNTFYK